MSRLTDPLSTKCSMSPWDWCGLDNVCNRDCFLPEPCKIPKLARRLAEYEDVLYTPDGTEPITLDRLRELVDADLDGRLVVLPCKVGDTVFTIELDCKDNPDHSQMCFCWNKSCKECDKSYLRVWENRNKTADIRSIVAEMGLCGESGGFGKTVFLTRALAEEAIAKEAQHE